ncbi:MAG: hypothetical protein AB8H03_05335 [Saprospiraceae bacterium]
MAYDVASSINELLFEKNSVIVPGFGGFELQQQPANIDHIKSTISPPNKVPSFNKNLTINDGVLVDYIQNQNNCTLEQANKIVADFVAEVEGKIEKKEIVEFPKVGRIYKDYNKSLQFLPYDTNFNVDAFGLPTIEIHPFSRSESVKKETATVAAASLDLTNVAAEPKKERTPIIPPPTPEPKPIREEIRVGGIPVGEDKGFNWTQFTMPLLVLASVVLIALSYFLLRDDKPQTADGNNTAASMPVNEDDDKKINTAPSIEDAEITTLPDDSNSENDQRLEDDIAAGNSNSNSIDTEDDTKSNSVTSNNSAGENECIIIVGQFGSEGNVKKMIRKLEGDGYESYEGWSEEKKLKNVGIRFTYSSDSKKENMLRKIRSKYDPDAWIYSE